MNTSSLVRGAALALLLPIAVPYIHATVLTVSQSATFAVSAETSGVDTAGTGVMWAFAPFNPALGTLESVTFTATATVTVQAVNAHYYGIIPVPPYTPPPPRVFNPYTALHVTAYPTPAHSNVAISDSDYSYGAPVLVDPFQLYSHIATHAATVSETVSDPTSLVRYSSPSPPGAVINIVGEGNANYGGVSLAGTVAASVTYTYRIDDAGGTAAMFAVSVAMAVAARGHRRKRSL